MIHVINVSFKYFSSNKIGRSPMNKDKLEYKIYRQQIGQWYFNSKQIKEETKRAFEYFVKPNDFVRNTI